MTEFAPIANQVQLPALFKLVADRIPGFAWSTDTDLRLTAGFGAGLAALDVQPSQFVGRTIFEYFQSTDENLPGVAPHRRALQGKVVDYEDTFLDRTFRAHIEPLRDEANNVIGCIGFAEDITEQRQAEAELRRSEARYRSVIDSAPAQVATVDREGTILFINRPAPGLTLEQVVGSRVYDYLQPEHCDQARRCIEHVFQTGESVVNESRATGPHGTVSWYETRLGPVKVDGQVIGVTLISSDITERKRAERELQEANERLEERVRERTAELRQANELLQAEVEQRRRAEQALRESEQWMQMALDVSRSFAFEWNVATDRVLRSDSCSRVLRLSGEEALHDTGQRFFQRVHVGDRERFLRTLGELKPSAHTYRTEYRATRGDGTTVVLEESARGFFDSAGMLRRLVGVTTDITDRKVAESALRQSEAKYKALVESSPDAILMCDLEGRIMFASPRAAEQHGCDDACELVGRPAADLVVPGDRDRLKENIRRVVQDGFRRNDQYQGFRRDGTTFFGEASASVIRGVSGEPEAFTAVYQDISERKLAQDALKKERDALQRMLQASDHDREMITFEIHDGVAQRLLGALMQFEAYDQQATHESEKLKAIFEAGLQAIREASAEARSLMNRTRTPVLHKFGVKAALADFIDQISQRPNAPEVMYRCEVEFRRLAPIIENAIFRVAQEALTNACLHSKSELVRVALVQDGEEVTLGVQDYGIGFDPATVAPGRFGLDGMRERSRSFGKELQLESTPGQGTRIRATFPVIAPDD